MTFTRRLIFLGLVLGLLLGSGAVARAEDQTKPAFLKGAGIQQNLGSSIPLDLKFTDSTGKKVRLGDFFGSKPVILTLVYYRCPMLCTLELNDLTRGLNGLDLNPGTDFQVLTVSFDPNETSQDAAEKKATYMQSYKRSGADENWHFLTGDAANIKALTDACGFHFRYDPQFRQFVHPSGVMVLTPKGVLSRYFFGIDYELKDLKLSILEASGNKIGSLTNQLLLYCFHYDPTSGKYSLLVTRILKVAALLTMAMLGTFWFVISRKAPAAGGFDVIGKDR